MLNHRARKSTSTLYYSLCITFLETSLDLNCVNDYEKEMTCHMTPDNTNDFGYLKKCTHCIFMFSRTFICRFEHIYSSACECKFQVNGFVVGETFKANLLRKGNVLFTKYIKTRESIKPKRPIIISISLTENGNFRITWDTKYTHGTVFYESLSVELTYSVKGIDQTNYEFVGRNLQPNSNYIVWARVVTNYNDIYSDYSEPYEFSTCKFLNI
uniref:Fibronectin type-III domain-containing protein n=1 Tax=Electrophorus electricus TaxID=8005 RepID=A0AAY5EYA8_ELEEL